MAPLGRSGVFPRELKATWENPGRISCTIRSMRKGREEIDTPSTNQFKDAGSLALVVGDHSTGA